MPEHTLPAMLAGLRRPFPVDSVEFRPDGTPANNADQGEVRCLCYISSRHVTSRLNAVVGWGWSDAYQETVGGMRCLLTINDATRADAGVGDDPKAAHSDAFKRAAVKFGVGEYLYALPKFKAEVKKFGRSYYLTNAGWAKLRADYAAWLVKAEAEWGKPLAHGDAEATHDEPQEPVPPADPSTPDQTPNPKASNGRASANGVPGDSGGTVQQKLLRALHAIPDHNDRQGFLDGFGVEYKQTAILALSDQQSVEILAALAPNGRATTEAKA